VHEPTYPHSARVFTIQSDINDNFAKSPLMISKLALLQAVASLLLIAEI
jgi:hypothetical protein